MIPHSWTFGRRLGLGFAITVLLAVLTGAVATFALDTVVRAKDRVIQVDMPRLLDAQRLHTASERRVVASRGFILSPIERFERVFEAADRDFDEIVGRLRTSATAEERSSLDRVQAASDRWCGASDEVWELRRDDTPLEVVVDAFESQTLPVRDELSDRIEELLALEGRRIDDARQASSDLASTASTLVVSNTLFVIILAIGVAITLTRSLTRLISTAVGQVQSSSAELQSAANQQATGAKEQSTAMREIATTITELLATSRQIAESAQRVAEIAGQTATGAREGSASVDRSTESIASIRRQVDLVVSHMLELGRKSQQIGAIVEIVSELGEQTNILAINATIEAAGAGDAGRRFAVVADEIRKLSDRVTGSAKEIRVLVDDVRSAVNTTVMATETGSKAVDAGTRQFAEVTTNFRRIVDLVGTTTDAAREIELSTKQQSTAVEQVNVAISNVAQATREAEASASQTLETASQLTGLSRGLLRVVEPEKAA